MYIQMELVFSHFKVVIVDGHLDQGRPHVGDAVGGRQHEGWRDESATAKRIPAELPPDSDLGPRFLPIIVT
jgi:hypothetical protein